MRKRIISLVMAICMLCGLALNGITISASAAETNENLTNIEDSITIPEGAYVPEGWTFEHASSSTQSKSVLPTFETELKEGSETDYILKVSRTSNAGTTAAIFYKFAEATSGKVTLEYRYQNNGIVDYTTKGYGYILPSLVYSVGAGGSEAFGDNTAASSNNIIDAPTFLIGRKDTVNYSSGTGSSDSVVNFVTFEEADYAEWHTVKYVVDLTAGTLDLWFDDNHQTLTGESGTDYKVDTSKQIIGFVIGEKTGVKGTFSLDNLNVTFGDEPVDDGINTEEELIAAIAEGGEIVITGDITLTQQIEVTKDVTISASAENPATITVSIANGSAGEAFGGLHVTSGTLTLGENLTVTNVDSAENGVSTVTTTGENAKLIVDGATVTSACKNNAIEAANGSNVTIKSGHVFGQQYTAAYASGGATITLEGGKVGHTDYAQYGLIASSTAATEGGNIVITGGEVTYVLAHEAATSDVTISGGKVTKYVKADNKGNVTISGGTINEVRGTETAGTVAITGGTFSTAPAEEYLVDGYAYDTESGTVGIDMIELQGNLELGSTLNMAFLFAKSERDNWEGYYAEVTMAGETPVRYNFSDWKEDEDENYYYIYFTGIEAHEMDVDITVAIYRADGVQVSTATTSIEDYANGMKELYPNTHTAVVEALLAYGAAAKAFFASQAN